MFLKIIVINSWDNKLSYVLYLLNFVLIFLLFEISNILLMNLLIIIKFLYLKMSVKVGVRVRPFNQREVALNCQLCVDMIGPTTRLYDEDDK